MKYKIVPGVILTSVGDSYFLISADKTIRVNETVSFYWKQLEKGADETELAASATEYYEIENSEILIIDIERMINAFLEMGILKRDIE